MSATNNPPPPLSSGSFEGIVALGLKNHRKRIFVPSRENIFANIKYPAVMLDSGCNTLLLPVLKTPSDPRSHEDFILSLREQFPPQQYNWRITHGNGVAARSIVLELTLRVASGHPSFQVVLGRDLGASQFLCDKLRFHLCTEDVVFVNSQLGDAFQFIHIEDNQSFVEAIYGQVRRRSHVLMGQALFNQRLSVDTGKYTFIFRDLFLHTHVQTMTNILRGDPILILDNFLDANGPAILPDRFDDLEDEDMREGESSFVEDVEAWESGDEE